MSSSKSLFGSGEWKNEIYFDPKSDSPTGATYFIKDDELRSKLAELIDTEENILEIWIYSHPLYEWQLTTLVMYHSFVVLETNRWYWSIEKNNEGITIQRSNDWTFVKSKYRRKSRITPIKERNHDSGRMKMKDLVNWLYEKDELNYRYNLRYREGTCQGFARRVFDQFARTKTCDPFSY